MGKAMAYQEYEKRESWQVHACFAHIFELNKCSWNKPSEVKDVKKQEKYNWSSSIYASEN